MAQESGYKTFFGQTVVDHRNNEIRRAMTKDWGTGTWEHPVHMSSIQSILAACSYVRSTITEQCEIVEYCKKHWNAS